MPAERVLTESQLRADNSFTEEVGRIQKARPDWDSLKSEFGSALTITDTPDGKRNGRLEDTTPDRRLMRRLRDMGRASKRMEADLGFNMRGNLQTVAFRAPDGSEERVPEHMADHVASKRGLRPLRRVGRPTHRTVVSASGIHFVYEAELGGDLEFKRAYRLERGTGREIEVPVG